MLKDLLADAFQSSVSEQLVCNRSVLDILSRHQVSSAKLHRIVINSVTGCGCMQIVAKKNKIPSEMAVQNLGNFVNSQLLGSLCPDCRDSLETEIGQNLAYLAALCNLLDINLFDTMIKAQNRMNILKHYNIT